MEHTIHFDIHIEPARQGAYFTIPFKVPGFARVELLRAFLPGLPMLPALISNPIYLDGEQANR